MNSTLLSLPFAATLDSFIRSLVAKNRTPATLASYRSDVGGFLSWLCETTPCAHPQEVTRTDVTEYLAERGQAGVSGLSRARNLAAIKEYFRYLVDAGTVTSSPAEAVAPRNARSAAPTTSARKRTPSSCSWQPAPHGDT